MKLATAKEHRDFFYKNGWIEFEKFISEETIAHITQALDQVLIERLKVSGEQLRFIAPDMLYLQGRDVWRSSPILQKFVTQMRFAEIAAELLETKSLRLGYDQFIPSLGLRQPFEGIQEAFSSFFDKKASLEAVSCIKGVCCGLIVALEDANATDVEEMMIEGIDIFPKKKGNAVYFKHDALINWNALYTHSSQCFYLIAYTALASHYILQPEDPHTHALKRLGYIFNDKLNDKLHPIVYR